MLDVRTVRSVGVIGGGVAGLSCARRLHELGVECTVFDTGKHAPGGRCSSRIWRTVPADHAAQYAEATSSEYAEYLSGLEREGVAFRLPSGSLGHVHRPGVAEAVTDGVPRYVGVGGMGSLTRAAAAGLDVRQDVWVSPSNGIWQGSDGVWHVKESRSVERTFDALVIAHNGKCAERLTSGQPSREIHQLLRARFAARVGRGGNGSGRMTLNSIYSLMFEVPAGTLPSALGACAFIHCEPALRFLSSNSAKHAAVAAGRPTEVWTALSSAAFGTKHKAPQEHLAGTEKETEVTQLLLEAIERAAGLPQGGVATRVVASKLQLWGAALPINAWASEGDGGDGGDGGGGGGGEMFAYSGRERIGIAGDWFASASDVSQVKPSSMESAWLSGRRLAQHLALAAKGPAPDVGLSFGRGGGAFLPVDAGGFGDSGGGSDWVPPPSEGGGEPTQRGRSRRPSRDASARDASARDASARTTARSPARTASADALFIRNVPYKVTAEALGAHLARQSALPPAAVASVELLVGDDGRPRGLARVRMDSAQSAAKAVAQADGQKLEGRPLRVVPDERAKR